MKRCRCLSSLALLIILCGLVGLTYGERNKLPDGFVLEPVLKGFDRPSAMVTADDGTVYVAERFSGKVFAVVGGKLVSTPAITVSVASGTDEGLLDLAYLREGQQGWLYLFYTEQSSGTNKVVRYPVAGAAAGSPSTVIDLGPASGHERPGGGLAIGTDGKLYVSVGDMGDGPEAQNDSSNLGKVLRLEPDGAIPSDNPDPASPVFAKGFRDGIGLAAYSETGTVYLTDRGPATGYDELNAVTASGNYGWDAHSGPGGGGGYTDPIDSRSPLVGPTRPGIFSGGVFPATGSDGQDNDHDGSFDERDENYADTAFYGCYDTDDVIRSPLTGDDLDGADPAHTFFDADIEVDGTPDTECPPAWSEIEEGHEGLLYGLADDATGSLDGIYRFVPEKPGAREVSAPGSIFPVTAEKSGGDITLYWENTGREAWVGETLGASQPAEKFTIWEGTLPITGNYSHKVKATTDGGAVNDGLLSASITPANGDTYYLLSAQADNLEGTLGMNAEATPAERPGKAIHDYCNEIGWYDNERGDAQKETECNGLDDDGDGSIDESCPGRCGPDFVSPSGGEARLLDQYGNYWTLHDFRGMVVHMDLSALDCYYCQQQASEFRDLFDEYRGRGFVTITALMNSYHDDSAIPPEQCAAKLQEWIDDWAPGADDYILCAVDDDGNGVADVWEQYGEHLYLAYGLFWSRCTGTPTNFYFDQGMVNYETFCGKTDISDTRATILEKLPAEHCE